MIKVINNKRVINVDKPGTIHTCLTKNKHLVAMSITFIHDNKSYDKVFLKHPFILEKKSNYHIGENCYYPSFELLDGSVYALKVDSNIHKTYTEDIFNSLYEEA